LIAEFAKEKRMKILSEINLYHFMGIKGREKIYSDVLQ
jgi:hypothetical protein